MATFYDQENDEGGSYEPEHVAAGPQQNLGHGPTCDHCNDALLNTMENSRRRAATFSQAINNLKSYKTDKAINVLAATIDRKPGFNPSKDS